MVQVPVRDSTTDLLPTSATYQVPLKSLIDPAPDEHVLRFMAEGTVLRAVSFALTFGTFLSLHLLPLRFSVLFRIKPLLQHAF